MVLTPEKDIIMNEASTTGIQKPNLARGEGPSIKTPKNKHLPQPETVRFTFPKNDLRDFFGHEGPSKDHKVPVDV